MGAKHAVRYFCEVGDLAYLIELRGLRRNVTRPFVVEGINDKKICSRSTGRVRGQEIKRFEAQPTLVARCYTAVYLLKDLLLTFDQSHVKVNSIDALATWHTSASPVM